MRRTTVCTVTAVLAFALALAGCTQDQGAGPDRTPSATDAAATPASTATPDVTAGPAATPTPGATPTSAATPTTAADASGTVPATCQGLLTAGRWDDSFAAAPLNDPSVVGDPVAIPKGGFTDVLQANGKRLYCVWRDPRADISYLSIQVDQVDASTASGVLDALNGYECTDVLQGRRCQKTSQDPQYPVIDGDTYFTRGDVAIRISQANVPTNRLLDDVVAHVF